MAKIRSKQLADFVAVYNAGTAATDILNAAAVSVEIAAAGTALSGGVNASIDSLELRAASVESINLVQSTAISTAEGDIDTLQTDLDNLDTRVGTAEGDISDLEGDLSSLDTRVGTAEGDIDTLQTDLGNLDTRVSTTEGDISDLGVKTTELDASVDSLEALSSGSFVAIENSVDSLELRTASVESINTVQSTAISTAVLNDAAHDASIDALETRMDTAETGIDTNANDIGVLQGEMSAVESVNSIQSTAISNAIASYESADSSLTSRLSTEESTRTSADTSLTTRISDVESIDLLQSTAISSLEAAIMQDFDMVEQILPGIVAAANAPTPYTLSGAVQDNDPALVQVFVNGHKVKCTVAAGNQATVEAPYAIDVTDVVTFLFQQA